MYDLIQKCPNMFQKCPKNVLKMSQKCVSLREKLDMERMRQPLLPVSIKVFVFLGPNVHKCPKVSKKLLLFPLQLCPNMSKT